MRLEPEITKHYGQALFNLTQKQGTTDQVLEDVRALLQLLPNVGSKVRNFLESPQFRIADQIKFIDTVFKDQIHQTLINLIDLLIQRRRIFYFEAILEEYERLVLESRSTYAAEVFTAVEIDQAQKENVSKSLEEYTKVKLEVKFRVDPSIIGGIIVKYQDLLIDDSIQNRFKNLKNQMHAARVVGL